MALRSLSGCDRPSGDESTTVDRTLSVSHSEIEEGFTNSDSSERSLNEEPIMLSINLEEHVHTIFLDGTVESVSGASRL
jgi:hypothetical protein